MTGETRRPWERADTSPAGPWKPPEPDTGPALTVRTHLEDEVAASRLVVDAMSPRGGLGSAILGGLIMLMAVTAILATPGKSPLPSGLSLLTIVALIAVFAGLGWLVGSRLLPMVRRRATMAHARRMLSPRPDAGPYDDSEAQVVLGSQALRWTSARLALRFDVLLLRGLVEDQGHMVLRFGLVSFIVLPRRHLTPDQQEAVRAWAAQHAREGQA